jgi:hypothetical protein
MLSDSQVNFVMAVSGAALVGLMFGALCGLLVGPTVRVLKTRNTQGLFVGFVLGIVPGAVAASTVALSIAIFETAAFPPSPKGGYELPDWFLPIMVCLVVVAGALASCCAARRDPPLESRTRTMAYVILWGFGGGVLSSIALSGMGFSGYFVVQSNSGPLQYAIVGFVFGAAIAALSRAGIAALGRCQPQVDQHKAWPHQGINPTGNGGQALR